MLEGTASEIVIPYRPRPVWSDFHASTARWRVAVAHRRAGKTVAFVNEAVRAALRCSQPDPRVAYIAPGLGQCKAIAWDYLKRFAGPIPGVRFHEAELRADLPNGGRIRLFGADNPNALRGMYVFNLGADPDWTIWKRLNARRFDEVPLQLQRFVHVGPRKLQGLVNRRAAEVALWSAGEPGSADEHPPSSLTREEATPPTRMEPKSLAGSRTFVSTASAGVATAAVAVGEVSRAVSPYAQQSAVVGRVVATLALVAAALAALGVLCVWLKRREGER